MSGSPDRREVRGASYEIDVETLNGRARLTMRGDLDLASRDAFIDEVRRIAGEVRSLEVDLTGLEVIDSVGLRALLEADRVVSDSGGDRLRLLISGEGPVRRLLELTLMHLTLDVRTA